MERNYSPAAAGRQIYIAKNGTELERKYVYANSQEWDDLSSLARTLGLPLGKMLISLAFSEIERIRQSQHIAPALQHASNR